MGSIETSGMSGVGQSAGSRPTWDANRLGLDYRLEAARLGKPPVPIVDGHLHVMGARAPEALLEAMDLYGIERLSSQTRFEDADAVKRVLGDRVRFVAIPDYMSDERVTAHTTGFLRRVEQWHDLHGAKLVKFWNAPRLRDFAGEDERVREFLTVDAPWRVRIAEAATRLGMSLMTHVGDPDTWFATKYADASVYGTKRSQYEGLERMLDRFDVPWLAAHMGGWPEDLVFLDGLLERHGNLFLDTSATKWMVRELSRHSPEELASFLTKWSGRVLFGSDIVTSDDHLASEEPDDGNAIRRAHAGQANSHQEAFELYASRYWALRVLFETDWEGQSPIADPDLAMVEPDRYDAHSAPMLRGKRLAPDLLVALYRGAARRFMGSWWDRW